MPLPLSELPLDLSSFLLPPEAVSGPATATPATLPGTEGLSGEDLARLMELVNAQGGQVQPQQNVGQPFPSRIASLLESTQAQEEAVRREQLAGLVAQQGVPRAGRDVPAEEEAMALEALTRSAPGLGDVRQAERVAAEEHAAALRGDLGFSAQAQARRQEQVIQANEQANAQPEMDDTSAVVIPSVSGEEMLRTPYGEAEAATPELGGETRVGPFSVGDDSSMVFTVPGASEPLPIPPQVWTNPAATEAYLEDLIREYDANPSVPRGGDIRTGARPAISAGAAIDIANAIRLHRAQVGTRPTGRGVPPSTMTTQFTQRQEADLSPETAEALAAAQEQVRRAQERSDIVDLGVQAGETESLNAMARRQEQLAEEARRQEADRQQRIESRLADFDRTLADVRGRRVDPEAFFGGAGGRIVAAISVALGQLGSALTGGPNTALQIINEGIERNMQAQQANVQSGLQAAQMEGTALNQFRAILGDEAAAQAATRASMLQAYETQLSGMMSGLRGPQLAAAQQLQAMIRQQAAVEAQAARERGRWSLERTVRTVQPVPRTAAVQAARGIQQQDIAQAQARQQVRAQQAAQAETARQQEAQDVADVEAGFEPFDRPDTATIPQSEEVSSPRLQRIRTQRATVNAALQANPNNPLAQSRARELDREQRRAARAAVRQAVPRFTGTTDDYSEMVNNLRERFPDVDPPAPGFIVDPRQEGSVARWRRTLANPTLLAEANNIMSQLAGLDRAGRAIMEARNEYGGEITDMNVMMVAARTMANIVRNDYRHEITGAAAGERELEEFYRLVPDPDEITAANAVGMWDRIGNALSQFFRARSGQLRDQLQIGHGATTNSIVGRSGRRIRGIGDNLDVYDRAIANWRQRNQ